MSNETASPTPPSSPFLLLNDKVYNGLKWLVLIVLPALGTAYFQLAGVWSLPNPVEILNTVMIVMGLLGALLGFSTRAYNKQGGDGVFTVNTADPNKDIFNLRFNNGDPINLAGKKFMRLKIDRIDT